MSSTAASFFPDPSRARNIHPGISNIDELQQFVVDSSSIAFPFPLELSPIEVLREVCFICEVDPMIEKISDVRILQTFVADFLKFFITGQWIDSQACVLNKKQFTSWFNRRACSRIANAIRSATDCDIVLDEFLPSNEGTSSDVQAVIMKYLNHYRDQQGQSTLHRYIFFIFLIFARGIAMVEEILQEFNFKKLICIEYVKSPSEYSQLSSLGFQDSPGVYIDDVYGDGNCAFFCMLVVSYKHGLLSLQDANMMSRSGTDPFESSASAAPRATRPRIIDFRKKLRDHALNHASELLPLLNGCSLYRIEDATSHIFQDNLPYNSNAKGVMNCNFDSVWVIFLHAVKLRIRLVVICDLFRESVDSASGLVYVVDNRSGVLNAVTYAYKFENEAVQLPFLELSRDTKTEVIVYLDRSHFVLYQGADKSIVNQSTLEVMEKYMGNGVIELASIESEVVVRADSAEVQDGGGDSGVSRTRVEVEVADSVEVSGIVNKLAAQEDEAPPSLEKTVVESEVLRDDSAVDNVAPNSGEGSSDEKEREWKEVAVGHSSLFGIDQTHSQGNVVTPAGRKTATEDQPQRHVAGPENLRNIFEETDLESNQPRVVPVAKMSRIRISTQDDSDRSSLKEADVPNREHPEDKDSSSMQIEIDLSNKPSFDVGSHPTDDDQVSKTTNNDDMSTIGEQSIMGTLYEQINQVYPPTNNQKDRQSATVEDAENYLMGRLGYDNKESEEYIRVLKNVKKALSTIVKSIGVSASSSDVIQILSDWEPKLDLVHLHSRWARHTTPSFSIDSLAIILVLARQCEMIPVKLLSGVYTFTIQSEKARSSSLLWNQF